MPLTARSLFCLWAIAATLPLVLGCGNRPSPQPAPPAAAERAKDPDIPQITDVAELDRLIDETANDNDAPELASKPRPLYAETFDWAEQARAMGALHTLLNQNGEYLWPRLLRHLDDKRYVFTCDDNGEVRNMTIENICWLIAYYDLVHPFGGTWPNRSEIPNIISEGLEKFFPPPHDDFRGWCNARQGKPLWELQAEVGEWSIKTIEGLKLISDEEKADRVARINAIIDQLRHKREPIVFKRLPFEPRGFTVKEANEIRERYKERVGAGLKPVRDSKPRPIERTYLRRTLNEWLVLAKSDAPNDRAYAARSLREHGERRIHQRCEASHSRPNRLTQGSQPVGTTRRRDGPGRFISPSEAGHSGAARTA